MRALKVFAANARKYPSAIAGIAIVSLLIIFSAYALITMTYDQAVDLWRGGEGRWLENPRNAVPIWYNLFPWNDLPESVIRDSRDAEDAKVVQGGREEREAIISLSFDYESSGFPKELTLFLVPEFEEKHPFVRMRWITPDGREYPLGEQTIEGKEAIRFSQDVGLQTKLGRAPHIGLFADPQAKGNVTVTGTYTLRVESLLFEPDADLDARLVVYGQAHGLFGTDHKRRDIQVALLWGTPIALAFGFLAAIGTTVITMIIAAFGVWYGRLADSIIQRITEVNLILPILPILVMIGTLYSKSIWVMLSVIVLLSIFGATIKTYRAIFIQVKESPYIEAAKAYGAKNVRIVFRYMIPRVLPVLVPQFVVLIPTYVFLEATLSILGLGDPLLPTWGKVLEDAYRNGALYKGYFYWVLQPAALLMITGLGFAMLGFALDRIFNPRLRGR
jgi:peptide/nickel transport system permease protein